MYVWGLRWNTHTVYLYLYIIYLKWRETQTNFYVSIDHCPSQKAICPFVGVPNFDDSFFGWHKDKEVFFLFAQH